MPLVSVRSLAVPIVLAGCGSSSCPDIACRDEVEFHVRREADKPFATTDKLVIRFTAPTSVLDVTCTFEKGATCASAGTNLAYARVDSVGTPVQELVIHWSDGKRPQDATATIKYNGSDTSKAIRPAYTASGACGTCARVTESVAIP